jgi:hypothetical protein
MLNNDVLISFSRLMVTYGGHMYQCRIHWVGACREGGIFRVIKLTSVDLFKLQNIFGPETRLSGIKFSTE